jgi:opacity protein-like surface antigen
MQLQGGETIDAKAFPALHLAAGLNFDVPEVRGEFWTELEGVFDRSVEMKVNMPYEPNGKAALSLAHDGMFLSGGCKLYIGGKLKPRIGAGIGMSSCKLNYVYEGLCDGSSGGLRIYGEREKTIYRSSYTAMAGLTCQLSDKISLEVRYQLIQLPKYDAVVKLFSRDGNELISQGSLNVEGKFFRQEVALGFHYSF